MAGEWVSCLWGTRNVTREMEKKSPPPDLQYALAQTHIESCSVDGVTRRSLWPAETGVSAVVATDGVPPSMPEAPSRDSPSRSGGSEAKLSVTSSGSPLPVPERTPWKTLFKFGRGEAPKLRTPEEGWCACC